MSGRINNFKTNLEQKYDNRLNPNSQRTVEIKLTIEERIKALVLEVIAVLGVIFSLGNQGWKNVAKELFAEVRTGVVYHARPYFDSVTETHYPLLDGSPSDHTTTRVWDPDDRGLESSSTINSCSADEQIANIVTALNAVDVHHAFGINEALIKQFIAKGGRIQLLEDGQKIPLKRDEQYIVGCSSGVNRSQTHAAYMIKHNLSVVEVLAGGDSAFNPTAEFAAIPYPYKDDADQKAFTNYFGFDKRPQLGSKYNNGEQMDKNLQVTSEVKEYYAEYINNLGPTHFIAYAMSGPSVLKRLLDSNKLSLEGFTLTFVNWADQIAHPVGSVAAFSQEAYRLFARRIAEHFPIVD